MTGSATPILPVEVDSPRELDFSGTETDDYEALSRDRVPVRSMEERDLAEMVAIDRRITGRDRSGYFRQKLTEALRESGVRVSLVAEVDGHVAGFIMARVDFGAFGSVAAEAVMDTIGVDPERARRGIGSALISQLLANLVALRVDRVRTELAWNDLALVGFLDRAGFRPSQRVVLRRVLGS